MAQRRVGSKTGSTNCFLNILSSPYIFALQALKLCLQVLLVLSWTVSTQSSLHFLCQWWDVLPGDEEGGHIEEVQEHLVPVTQGGPEVLVT